MDHLESRRRRRLANAAVAVAVAVATASWAGAVQGAPPAITAAGASQPVAVGAPTGFSGFLGSLNRSNYMLGDLFGLRTRLSRYGVSFAVQETSEVLGNASGGVRRGADYDGLTQAIVQLDTQRAFGWYGGLFNASALQVHGRDLSTDDLASIETASGIEADRSTRLWELWYDQKFLGEDRADVRIGLQSADQEFIVSANAGYFVNTMFGWPALPSYDLPGGGPAYPLSAPAIRLRLRPADPVRLLLGVYNASPVSDPSGDPQLRDASGLNFPVRGGALVFVELQYAYPALGGMVFPGAGAPLGHTYKIGAWWDTARFDDRRFDAQGRPLAAPTGAGVARRHRGDVSLYAVADQMLWRQPDDPNRSVSVFARVMGAPQSDRNFIGFSANLGLTYRDPLPNRSGDTFALGGGYARVSSAVSGADRDAAMIDRQADPTRLALVRHDETYLEATYQYQVRPWLQIQPDCQYVFSPGGGIANPNAPTQRVHNELVFGARTNVLF